MQANQYTPYGGLLTQTFFSPEQPGLAVFGDVVGEAPLPQPNNPVYSFALNQGESATIVIESLNDTNVSFIALRRPGQRAGDQLTARPITRPA